MAETEAAAGGAKLDVLTKKMGPFPLIVWIAVGALALWYYRKHQAAASGSAGAVPNQQTDPAGNIGSIDPATGYVYGTPEDTAALASNNAGTGTGTDTGSSGGSTTAGQYPDNNSWANAAINFLVARGIDPTTANSAITQFLASQSLTPEQQADVNLAIQSLGAPPSPPQPGTAPSPIVQPPSPGTTYASNPPSGVAISSTGATSLGVKWNKVTNSQGYTIKWGTTSAASTGSATVTGTQANYTITGLKPNTLYYVQVQATPAKAGDPFGSTSKTTLKSPTGGGGGTPSGGGQKYTEVTVVKWTAKNTPWNSTLSGIADHYHVNGGYQALAKLNGISNPNLIHPGQQIKVPVS